MKNILVTGGAGFIGSNFIKYMIAKYEYNIVNLDLLTYAANLKNLASVEQNKKYTFIHGDICDNDLVSKIFKEFNIDAVVNFAAETHVDNSIENSYSFVKTNVLGTQNLLEKAKNAWKVQEDKYCTEYNEGKKFLQISTDEVYGSLSESGLFKEDSKVAPRSPYAASKASGDMLVLAYKETYNLPVSITRCSNNYGENQFLEKLIPLIINNCVNDKDIPIYGDGLQVRDWIYVMDHCKGIDLVLHKGELGEVYNIGVNCEKTNLEIAKFIIEKLGKNESLIKHVKDRLGHDRRYGIDNSKIVESLGFYPDYMFEKAMEKTINWYLNNKNYFSN